MKRLLFTAVALALVAGAGAAVEFGLRLYGLGSPLLYYETPAYGYALRPSQRAERLRGAVVTIDDAGLRGTRPWSRPADRKLLFVGDSITYGGSYIDDAALFSERACDRLRERSALAVVCGNAGINAYGVDNMAARLRYGGYDDADVIVVTVNPGDALRGMARLRSFPYFAKPPPAPLAATVELVDFGLDRLRLIWRFAGAPAPTGGVPPLRVAGDSLDRLFTVLRARRAAGARIILVYSPARFELKAGGETPLTRLVSDRLRDAGFAFVDMRGPLAGGDLDALYYDGVHLEVAGHALYGRVIGDAIAEVLAAPAPAG